MKKLTSQQIIDSLGYESGPAGKPVVVGAALDQTTNTVNMLYSVPAGHVFLVTHFVSQGDYQSDLGSKIGSPQSTETYTGFSLYDASGTLRDTMTFRNFARYNSTFLAGGSPAWQTAAPGNAITWKPKYPVVVPARWSIRENANQSRAWGNFGAVYGIVVDEQAARNMGYSVRGSNTASEKNYGVISSTVPSTATTLLAAKTGKSIHITDVFVQMQPQTNSTNRLILQQSDGQLVLQMQNNNPAEFLSTSFSPGWYLKPGVALEVDGDVAIQNSINIIYEYVDQEEVPGDYWFSVVDAVAPTPGTATIGNAVAPFTVTHNEVTCYYPRRGLTKTSPTQGFQHFVNGWVVSCQKTSTTANTVATDDTEQTRIVITTGSSGGSLTSAAAGATQDQYQLSPVYSASGYDQCMHSVLDGVHIPCKKDDGSIWVDAFGFKALAGTPSAADADIAGLTVSIWGTTRPSAVTDRSNRGT